MKTKEEPTILITKETYDRMVLENLFKEKYLEYIMFHEKFITIEEFRKIYNNRMDFTK